MRKHTLLIGAPCSPPLLRVLFLLVLLLVSSSFHNNNNDDDGQQQKLKLQLGVVEALASRYSNLGAHHLYHHHHQQQQVLGTCAGCSEPIFAGGKYLEALGQKWHPHHFACHNCRRPFPSHQFYTDPEERFPFCEPCYQDLFLDKCQICCQPLVGTFYETFFGEKYCEHHQTELVPCFSCQRPIADTLTRGGVQYADGRSICNLCFQHGDIVNTQAQAQYILEQIWNDLIKLGFPFDTATNPEAEAEEMPSIQLVQQMNWSEGESETTSSSSSRGSNRGTSTNTDGTVQITTHSIHTKHTTATDTTQTTTIQQQQQQRTTAQIEILHGLPRIHFASIVAHELGHVYIHIHHQRNKHKRGPGSLVPLPKQVEEGLCELMACAWLKTQQSQTQPQMMQMQSHDQQEQQQQHRDAEYRYQLKVKNKDPIYGGGLRAALAAIGGNTRNAPQLFQYVLEHGRFPQ